MFKWNNNIIYLRLNENLLMWLKQNMTLLIFLCRYFSVAKIRTLPNRLSNLSRMKNYLRILFKVHDYAIERNDCVGVTTQKSQIIYSLMICFRKYILAPNILQKNLISFLFDEFPNILPILETYSYIVYNLI